MAMKPRPWWLTLLQTMTSTVEVRDQWDTNVSTAVTNAIAAATTSDVSVALRKWDSRGVKPAVALYLAANDDLSGEVTQGGYTTSVSRVFAGVQTDATQIGIYTTGAGAWTRVTDFDAAGDLTYGAFCEVLYGTYAGMIAQLTTQGTIVVGTTPLASAVAAARLAAAPASATFAGAAEKATSAEVQTSTDDERFVSPLGLQAKLGVGTTAVAANDLTLLDNGVRFIVSGNTTVNGISLTASGLLLLELSGAPLLKHNTAPSSGFKKLKLAGAIDLQAAAGDRIAFWYDGTDYVEFARSRVSQGATGSANNTNTLTIVNGLVTAIA